MNDVVADESGKSRKHYAQRHRQVCVLHNKDNDVAWDESLRWKLAKNDFIAYQDKGDVFMYTRPQFKENCQTKK